MSAINVNSITGRTGSHGPVLTGVTTISGDLHVGSGLSVTGVSTLSNTVVGGATTELVVGGDARITGILTIGTGSVTIDGTSGNSSITGVTTVGITSAYITSINDLNYPTAGPLSNRNLIINGAMRVAQRGISSTSSGYHTIDRFLIPMDGGTFSQSQEDVSTSDLPYTNDGISKFARITNTTAPPNTTGFRGIRYSFESQDLYNSGWQYQSPTSFVTVSFWVRASVSQKFYTSLEMTNGTSQKYVWGFTPAANTWTKVTKVIPGFASISLNNDVNLGAHFNIGAFWGTNFTDNGVSEDAWEAWVTGTRFPDFSTTWKDTAGATFDITGVQLEVGTRATPFEHENYGQTLAKCQRYAFVARQDSAQTGFMNGAMWTSAVFIGVVHYPVTMRAKPDVTIADLGDLTIFSNGSTDTIDAFVVQNQGLTATEISISLDAGLTGGNSAWARLASGGSNSKIVFNAEL